MNCNCLKRVEKNLTEHLKPEAGDDIAVIAMNTSLAIPDDGPMRLAIMIPFRVKGSGKGYSRANGKEVPVEASHCPFCSRSTKRYIVGEDAGLSTAFGGAA